MSFTKLISKFLKSNHLNFPVQLSWQYTMTLHKTSYRKTKNTLKKQAICSCLQMILCRAWRTWYTSRSCLGYSLSSTSASVIPTLFCSGQEDKSCKLPSQINACTIFMKIKAYVWYRPEFHSLAVQVIFICVYITNCLHFFKL